MTKGKEQATKRFAERLDDLVNVEQKKQGKKANEIAREVGIASGTMSKYRSDAAEAGITNLAKIADHYGVSTDYLLGRSEILSPKNDVQFIVEHTGLSESAVNLLITMHRQQKDLPAQRSMGSVFIEMVTRFIELKQTLIIAGDLANVEQWRSTLTGDGDPQIADDMEYGEYLDMERATREKLSAPLKELGEITGQEHTAIPASAYLHYLQRDILDRMEKLCEYIVKGGGKRWPT